jgi:hypothetical protein
MTRIGTTTPNQLHPAIREDVLDGGPLLRIGMQHSQQQTSQCLLGYSREDPTTHGIFGFRDVYIRLFLPEILPPSNELGVIEIVRFRNFPRHSAEEKSQADDGAGPDIQWSGIIVTYACYEPCQQSRGAGFRKIGMKDANTCFGQNLW